MYENDLINSMLKLEEKGCKEKYYDKLKLSIIDTLGVSLLGAENHTYKEFLGVISTKTSSEESFLWGSVNKVNAVEATFLNTLAGHIDDFDSILYSTFGHPTVMIVPALFSIYESKGGLGSELLDSLLVGIEIMSNFGELFGEGLRENKLHPTPILGSLGVVSSLGYFLKFNKEKYVTAFSLVGSYYSGFQNNFGTDLKPFQVAKAASNSVESTLYVYNGIKIQTGNNFIDNLVYLSDFNEKLYIPKKINENYCKWSLEEQDFMYKKFPCCGYFQHVIIGTYDFYKLNNLKYGLTIKDIKKISLILPEYIKAFNKFEVPTKNEEARFSLKFNMALYLIYEKEYLGNFNLESFKNKEIINLIKKIEIVYKKDELCIYDNDINGKVEISYSCFANLEQNISLAKENCFSDKEFIYEKFFECAKTKLSFKEIEKVLLFIDEFEKTDSYGWEKLQYDIFKKGALK